MQQMQTAPRPYSVGPGGGMNGPPPGGMNGPPPGGMNGPPPGGMRPLGPPGPVGPPNARLVTLTRIQLHN